MGPGIVQLEDGALLAGFLAGAVASFGRSDKRRVVDDSFSIPGLESFPSRMAKDLCPQRDQGSEFLWRSDGSGEVQAWGFRG